jgi:hypothetical protein
MRTNDRWVSAACSVGVIVALAAPAARGEAQERRDEHVLVVELPPGVTRDEARRPDGAVRERLRARIAERLRVRPAAEAAERLDVVALLVDEAGRPLTPDLDAAREARVAAATPTDLTFTYDTPANPWTAEELATLQSTIATVYPVIRAVYGPPAFSITVDVVKDPSLAYVGAYAPWGNTLYLRGADAVDVICHELIHAFRDDKVISMSIFEEGMTRAAEVEVFNRLPALGHWDLHHGHGYDTRYETLSRRAIAAPWGQFGSWFNPFLRYQLAGMAWAKPLLENPAFLAEFNRRLYAVDYAWEPEFVDFAAAAQPTVEGRPFAIWYQQQPILDRRPPAGTFIHQRPAELVGVLFQRTEQGTETPVANADVQWSIRDARGAVLFSGTSQTGWNGYFSHGNDIPSQYDGRIEVTASAAGPGGPVADVAYDRHACQGVFGVVLGADAGAVTFTPLSGQAAPETVPVVDGAFCAAGLADQAGPIRADYTGPGGLAATRIVTKDTAPYLAVLRVGDRTPPALQLPAREVRDAEAPDGAFVGFIASATDDLDPRPAVACSPRSGSRFPIGTTAVRCEAWDEGGNASTGAFKVHVKGAPEQIADLGVLISTLSARRGLRASLEAKLASALWAVLTGRGGAACRSLAAVVAEAEAQSGTGLTPDDAGRVAGDATRIRAVLACP